MTTEGAERDVYDTSPELARVGVTRIHDWFRLLRALIVVVLPTAVAGMLVTTATPVADRPGLDEVLSMMVNLVVHTCFWVSLVYAYIDWRERTGEVAADAPPQLTLVDTTAVLMRVAPSTRRVRLGEVIVPMSVWASFVAFSFGQRRVAPLDQHGSPIPVLAAEAWPEWLPWVAWMAANATAALIATFRMGRWTPVTAVAAIATSLVVVGETIRMIATDRWISDAYLMAMRTTPAARDTLRRQLTAASLAIVVVVAAWTVIIAARGWCRDRSAPPLSYHA